MSRKGHSRPIQSLPPGRPRPLRPGNDRIVVAAQYVAKSQTRTHAPQQSAFYSITSSARASSDGGMVKPSAFAVFRLITNWNLVGRSTGSSDGFSPFRILSM